MGSSAILTSPTALQMTAGETACSGLRSRQPCCLASASYRIPLKNVSGTSYATGTTIAARVLSTKALTLSCSVAGTENLSREAASHL
jgi:hypothetical protein